MPGKRKDHTVPTYTQPNANMDASHLRVAMAVSTYHSDITTAMREGAEKFFKDCNGQSHHLAVIECPGAWELPVAIAAMCDALDPPADACLALGCVIQGETSHDQWINASVSDALMAISVNAGVPVSFGLLTCENLAQAKARSGGDRGNKGAEAMAAAIAQALANEDIQWGTEQ